MHAYSTGLVAPRQIWAWVGVLVRFTDRLPGVGVGVFHLLSFLCECWRVSVIVLLLFVLVCCTEMSVLLVYVLVRLSDCLAFASVCVFQ